MTYIYPLPKPCCYEPKVLMILEHVLSTLVEGGEQHKHMDYWLYGLMESFGMHTQIKLLSNFCDYG